MLTNKQWFGLPLIAAVPLLALFGVFGESTTQSAAHSARLDVHVESPDRLRYRQTQSIHVAVRNSAAASIDTVRVSFDTAYVSRFSGVTFEPSPSRAFVVPLTNLLPGDERLVAVELSGQRYGRHTGYVIVTAGADTVSVALSTFVFP